MSTQPKPYYTPEEYLAIERRSQIKHEYYRGEMFAMGGASREHNLIVMNLVRELSTRLKHRPCEVYPSDMRVKIDDTGLYTYPDVSVVCGEPLFEDNQLDTLLNPKVVIEVLSKSTENYDRGRKAEHYRTIASLAEYVLVDQERAYVEHYTRHDEGHWLLESAHGLEAELRLESLDCTLPLAEVYDKVPLAG